MVAEWTLDELVRRVTAALAGGAYPGAPNGRVRDVPDRRAVRWYATIGLVDRPAGTRGRTALYGVAGDGCPMRRTSAPRPLLD